MTASENKKNPGIEGSAGRAMVYDPDRGHFAESQLETPPLMESQLMVGPTLSAICGSDLHTVDGHRHPGGPLVLGHEICGTLLELPAAGAVDFCGRPLVRGDRVTWSLTASCGHCFFCRAGLPQKCETVFKYGHATVEDEPALSGGFADRIYLRKGTAVFHLPDHLADELAVFANCALATAAAAVRQSRLEAGESVLIQGGGLLGLCTAATAREKGAGSITIVESDPERQRWAAAFHADKVVAPGSVKKPTRGFDVAFEMCGQPKALDEGLASLRTGGRYVLCGCVFPGAETRMDLDRVTRGCLELIGVHNYVPEDLKAALRLLENAGRCYPFDQVVAVILPLESIEEAFELARTRKDMLRVALGVCRASPTDL